MDRNLLHISYEAGILEDPWLDASDPKNRGCSPRSRVFARRRAGQAGVCRRSIS